MRLYCFRSRSLRLPKICFKRPVTMSFTGKIKPQSLASGRPSANAREALECIEKNSPLGQIVQKAENSLKLQGAIAQALQQQGLEKTIEWVQIGALNQGELKLHTQHAGVSSRITQKIPSILAFLQQRGVPVEKIVIRQTPGGGLEEKSTEPPHEVPRTLSSKARESLQSLMSKVDQDSELYRALKKLTQRS